MGEELKRGKIKASGRSKRPCMAEGLSGRRFGRLVAGDMFLGRGGVRMYECRCDCGNLVKVAGYDLLRGHTVSCGCWGREARLNALTKHGGCKTRLYRIWADMKTRCSNPRSRGWRWYGARGVRVCPEWETFAPFRDWAMTNGYEDSLTIDRIDRNGDYCPENCRWATWTEQNRNKDGVVELTFNGRTMFRAEWCKELGIDSSTLCGRIARHGIEVALSVPNMRRPKEADNG